mmetsp:Transcript_90247/g.193455  ORF Transcript_90247/g.193455 Transcript_90247/m.193455 type:complete len:665 (+) Transcript_90247:136-2130(+)
MDSFKDWGSSILGQASAQLGPAAAAASGLVKSGAKAVKSSLKENLGVGAPSAVHTFDESGGGVRTVAEVQYLAEGAFGAVVKVRESNTGKEYALKKISCKENVQVASSLEAAEREAQVLSQLPLHPNIIRCFGSSVNHHPGGGSTVKLLLELCSAGHLLDYMDSRGGQLSAKEILDPFGQVVEAIRHLHAQTPPIQHRDLKAENVLKGSDGRWKLCDFGSCSTELIPPQELPRSRLMALQEDFDKTVTMLYRPPEMADIELNFRKGYSICEQVDIWMLGCILYMLMFYRHPFQDNATAMAISNAKYFLPIDHPMARNSKLCGLIHWLLAADPKDRPDAVHLGQLLRTLEMSPYPALLESMPLAVQDKINKTKALFAKRNSEDPDIPLPGTAAATAAVAARRAPAKQQAAPPRRQARPVPGAVAGVDAGVANFDLRSSLATEVSAPAAAGTPAGADDLLSFCDPAAPAVAMAPLPTTTGRLDDLLDFGSCEPATVSRASAPVAASGADWGDFASFAPEPPKAAPALAVLSQDGRSPCPGGGLSGFDFADFSSVPPALVPNVPSSSLLPMATFPAAFPSTTAANPAFVSSPAAAFPAAFPAACFAAAHPAPRPAAYMTAATHPEPITIASPGCGRAARAGGTEGNPSAGVMDINAMLSQQANMLDL